MNVTEDDSPVIKIQGLRMWIYEKKIGNGAVTFRIGQVYAAVLDGFWEVARYRVEEKVRGKWRL